MTDKPATPVETQTEISPEPVVAAAEPAPVFSDERLPSRQRMAFMFAVACLFLVTLAYILHGGISIEEFSGLISSQQIPPVLWVAGVFWLMIVIESLYGIIRAGILRKDVWLRFLLLLFLPGFRLMISTQFANQWVWLPRLHWQPVGRETIDLLERRLALPMLLITLLILPVIGAELLMQKQIDSSPLLEQLLHLITAFIWLCFTMEFILSVSATEKKLDYCKKNWINIVIILLPLIAFLRTLQIFRFLRLTKASKLVRAYRLRGVVARSMRIVLMLNLLERLMQRNPEKYLAHLQEKIQEKETELAELYEKLQQVKTRLSERDD